MPYEHPDLPALAEAMLQARKRGSTVALLIGAHVLKRGLGRYVRTWSARAGAASRASQRRLRISRLRVLRCWAVPPSRWPRYIREGQFGLWKGTGQLNDLRRRRGPRGPWLRRGPGKARRREAVSHQGRRSSPRRHRSSRPGDRTRGNRIRHRSRASETRRGRRRLGELSRFPHLHQGPGGPRRGVVLCYGTAVIGRRGFYLKAWPWGGTSPRARPKHPPLHLGRLRPGETR